MTFTLSTLADLLDHGFDDIIDVRSPSEFAEDHLPGAINLPVLSDAERARVGTIYVQESRFTARKIGGALVARNAALHLETTLADRDGGWQPLVYCWRGGQRSGSFSTILKAVGWRVELLDGGYRSYRRAVVAACYDHPVPARVILLDGNTGTAKTALLHRLTAAGLQTLDLEGLGNHRGSLFGSVGPQPSQKAFEGAIAMALARLDPSRPVVVEAESSKVGNLLVPPTLWKAMQTAPRLRIDVPVPERAAFLARAYADIVADPQRLDTVLDKLVPLHGHDTIALWKALARDGAFEALASDLIERHYDPRYNNQRGTVRSTPLPLTDLTEAGLSAAIPDVITAIEALHAQA